VTKASAASALAAGVLGAFMVTAVPAIVGWDRAPVRAGANDVDTSSPGVTSPTIEVIPQPRHTEDWRTRFEGLGGR
jgi:hypothetical protein